MTRQIKSGGGLSLAATPARALPKSFDIQILENAPVQGVGALGLTGSMPPPPSYPGSSTDVSVLCDSPQVCMSDFLHRL